MAVLSYNEVLPKTLIIMDGEPYEVISAWVFRKQQRKPVNQVKMRNLKSGSMMEHTFHVSDKVDEAEVEARTAKFISSRRAWKAATSSANAMSTNPATIR